MKQVSARLDCYSNSFLRGKVGFNRHNWLFGRSTHRVEFEKLAHNLKVGGSNPAPTTIKSLKNNEYFCISIIRDHRNGNKRYARGTQTAETTVDVLGVPKQQFGLH